MEDQQVDPRRKLRWDMALRNRIEERFRDWAHVSARQRIPIIACTAHALQGARARALDAGMDDFVTKPIGPAALESVLERWATGGVADGTSIPPPPPEILSEEATPSPKIIGMFMDLVPKQIDDIEASLDAGDYEIMGRHAHKLKGSSLAVGARAMVHCCKHLEKVDDRELASKLLTELRRSFSRTRDELQSRLAETTDV